MVDNEGYTCVKIIEPCQFFSGGYTFLLPYSSAKKLLMTKVLSSVVFRTITAKDDPAMESIIKKSLEEHNMAIDGTVYTDPVIKNLSHHFKGSGARYFVAEMDGKLCGGGGIAALPNAGDNTCELQRMFLDAAYRKLGIGYGILKQCIDYAKEHGYTFCYLETSEKLPQAIALYEKFGFKYLEGPMGNTGHFSCTTYMGLELT